MSSDNHSRGNQHGNPSFFTTIFTVFAVLAFVAVASILEMLGLIDHADVEEAVEEFTDTAEKDGGRDQHPERLGEKDGVFRECDGCGERRDLFVVYGEHLCAECLQ